MMLRCRCCGKSIVIAKHVLAPWYLAPEATEKINKFFDEHYYCKNTTKAIPNSFELISEFGEGFPREEDEVLLHYYDIYDEDYNTETRKQDYEYKFEQVHSTYLEDRYMNEEVE